MYIQRLAIFTLISLVVQSCATMNNCAIAFEYPVVRVGAEGSWNVALEGVKDSIESLGYSLESEDYVPLNGVCFYKIMNVGSESIKAIPYVQDPMPRYLWQINNEVSDAIIQKLGSDPSQYEIATEIILQD